MNGDLLEAFGALTLSVYDEIHRCYPELLRARDPAEISDEALVAWRLLLGIEELFVLMDVVERRCVGRDDDDDEADELLPF